MLPKLDSIVLHHVSARCERFHDSYSGVARGDLRGLLCIVQCDQQSVFEKLDACLQYYSAITHDEGSMTSDIPINRDMIIAIKNLMEHIDWGIFQNKLVEEHEFIASYVCSESISKKVIVEAVENKISERGITIAQQPVFYGFDILEWTSNWSLLNNYQDWDELSFNLNEYGLLPTWEDANKAWKEYLKVEDDYRGELEWYRIVGVVGLGELEVD